MIDPHAIGTPCGTSGKTVTAGKILKPAAKTHTRTCIRFMMQVISKPFGEVG